MVAFFRGSGLEPIDAPKPTASHVGRTERLIDRWRNTSFDNVKAYQHDAIAGVGRLDRPARGNPTARQLPFTSFPGTGTFKSLSCEPSLLIYDNARRWHGPIRNTTELADNPADTWSMLIVTPPLIEDFLVRLKNADVVFDTIVAGGLPMPIPHTDDTACGIDTR